MKAQGYEAFSIEGKIKSRTLGKSQWAGRMKVPGEGGLTLPIGFDLSLLQ